MRIRKIDFMELLFLLLVLTGEHFFYLVNLPITEMDLAVIIAVVMFFVYLLYYKGVGLPNTDKPTKILLTAIALMVVCSAVRSQQSYGTASAKILPYFAGLLPDKKCDIEPQRGI